jgi:uncharacterized protein (DUF2235 family)
MGKRIVICCDGTGNGFDPIEPESNVTKYYSILTINSEQTVLLSSGCLKDGLPPPTAVGASNAEWSRLKGLAFGSELSPNVGDAYRFLMDTYCRWRRDFPFGKRSSRDYSLTQQFFYIPRTRRPPALFTLRSEASSD